MPAPYGQRVSSAVSNVTVSASAETVVMTISGINTDTVIRQVGISGFLAFTPGTAANSVAIRCRRGTVGGTGVGTGIAAFCTAGDTIDLSFAWIDQNPEQAGAVYVITAQQSGASATGTVLVGNGSAMPY